MSPSGNDRDAGSHCVASSNLRGGQTVSGEVRALLSSDSPSEEKRGPLQRIVTG